jgi:hypothetical protein
MSHDERVRFRRVVSAVDRFLAGRETKIPRRNTTYR